MTGIGVGCRRFAARGSRGATITAMSRGTTRPLKRQKERQHPSIYFFIVLAIGVVFLMWLFITSIRQPPRKTGALRGDPESSAAKQRMAISAQPLRLVGGSHFGLQRVKEWVDDVENRPIS